MDDLLARTMPTGGEQAGSAANLQPRNHAPETQPLLRRVAQETLGRLSSPSDVNLFDGR